MKYTILLLCLFSFLAQPLFCQNIPDSNGRDVITLKYYRKGAIAKHQDGIVYKFDQDGRLLSLKSHFLELRGSMVEGTSYKAFYSYDEQGNLLGENVFEVTEDGSTLFRITKYNYTEDCKKAMIYDAKNKELLGEIEDCKGDTWRRQSFNKDIVQYGRPSLFHAGKVDWKWNDDNLIERVILSSTSAPVGSFNVNCQISQKPNSINVLRTWTIPDSLWTINLHRFNDRRNRLIKLGATDKKKDWYVKFEYGDEGFLEKITRRGRMHKTNEKVIRYFIVEINLPENVLISLKKNKTAIRKINEEFLKLHFPLTGLHLDYIDSRRFFQ